MNIVRGFLTDPEVLFLDEPTLGLDVGASRDVRTFIREWMNEQPARSLLLTTHYMVEADELCDRVAIINGGRVLACDTPSALKHRLQARPTFAVDTTPLDGERVRALAAVAGVTSIAHHEGDGRTTLVLMLEHEQAIGGVIAALEAQRIGLLHLTRREPTLEDVFVDLVGRSMEEVEHVAAGGQ
jgi:ABC-2 type transport system ATP-binding protein